MRGKDQRRLAVVRHFHPAVDVLARNDDAVDTVRIARVPVPNTIHLREFAGEPPEIVPDTAQDNIEFGRRFLRKCRGEVGASDLVFGQPRSERSQQPAAEIGEFVRIEQPQELQQADRERANGRIARALEPLPHQKFTMTLPNTCRLSSRARPFSKSARATSVSMIGAMPAAILARLSRMLRIEQPNDPKILYCCWNSCIKLMVTVGPAGEPQVTSRPPRLRQSSEALKPSPPTCSNTTSTPFFPVSLRVTPSKRSVL